MCGTSRPAQHSSVARSTLLGATLTAGLALAAGPAAAGVACVLDSKAPRSELIAACNVIIDQTGNPRRDRSAALVVRANANARTEGGLNQALKDLDRAIALDGKYAPAYRVRGDLLREAGGDLGRAAADLSTAIKLDPNDAEAYEMRGIVYTNQHRFDRALADYDQAIKLKPDYAQAWSDRGTTFYLGGDNEKAVRDFNEALRLDPNHARAHANRAAAYRKLDQLDKSIADETEAIRLDPTEPEFFNNRGLSYADLGEYDKAIADYDQALRLEQRPNFFTNRGDSHQFKGALGAALSDYDAALRLDPKFALAYNNRAVLYSKMGERKKALADFETVLRLDPGNRSAADGRRSMIAEIAKFGATTSGPMHARSADDSGPSFDCATARREVEKVICADPQLGVLDRQIAETYERVLKSANKRSAGDLRRTQRDFLATRNASFGRPGYDLKKVMQERLQRLNAMES
ncbi:tetratricopeptide repeat protein [Bradyrhizobium cajani]|uniref:Tetratricopeptide repeat protein n=1 Tax=Bradyrhizobium cajani TaxID=1928661 RepID=A0A844TCV2_9BRAD|nr:tetratricopeptide repeat protein [Bradyrhizobium cajani]MCP3370473.1 tetratricopeptide repeat protein [Bradyrhizobium cajani]MVT75415.1 tetratricopeptide repeat protein [Bradyrhizobium cajani]